MTFIESIMAREHLLRREAKPMQFYLSGAFGDALGLLGFASDEKRGDQPMIRKEGLGPPVIVLPPDRRSAKTGEKGRSKLQEYAYPVQVYQTADRKVRERAGSQKNPIPAELREAYEALFRKTGVRKIEFIDGMRDHRTDVVYVNAVPNAAETRYRIAHEAFHAVPGIPEEAVDKAVYEWAMRFDPEIVPHIREYKPAVN